MRYFVRPAPGILESESECYIGQYRTYAHYNYLRPGPIAALKRRRFDIALHLARPWFYKTGAIDFGCADGVLLPSLARYFTRVAAVDHDPRVIPIAKQVVEESHLESVDVINSHQMPLPVLRARLAGPRGDREYGVMFLLETLEHVGPDAPAGTDCNAYRVQFLRDLIMFLAPPARIIISIPRMTGIGFLTRYVTQTTLGLAHEHIPVADALKAGILGDTSGLESQWTGGHLGFNERKMERELRKAFNVVEERRLPFTLMYTIERRPADALAVKTAF
ncbi:MAG TPA: methyltransferase domain-containing protein [Gemmatimonadaceae bacterium]|nr:methyltransferase domain-containing protein [Gemmatimonadaceae bacterium]